MIKENTDDTFVRCQHHISALWPAGVSVLQLDQ